MGQFRKKLHLDKTTAMNETFPKSVWKTWIKIRSLAKNVEFCEKLRIIQIIFKFNENLHGSKFPRPWEKRLSEKHSDFNEWKWNKKQQLPNIISCFILHFIKGMPYSFEILFTILNKEQIWFKKETLIQSFTSL